MVAIKERTDGSDIDFEISDFSGQLVERVRYPRNATVGEVVREMAPEMGLASTDHAGAEYVYHMQSNGRHLHAAERLGDVIEDGRRVTLAPEISAGAHGARQ